MASRTRPPRNSSSIKAKASEESSPALLNARPKAKRRKSRALDPDHPLSLLREDRRGSAARRRVLDQLVKLLNVLLDGANYVDSDVRQRYLTLVNVTRTMIAVARRPAATASDQAAESKALGDLERSAMKILEAMVPDEQPLVPSTHYDLHQKYNLTSSKMALLDAVAQALEGRVHPSEQEDDGRLDLKSLYQILSTREMPKDEGTQRAGAVALDILWELITKDAYARLLVRPAYPDRLQEDLERLTCVINKLMEQSNATVVQVARAVLCAFDVDARGLKNFFSPKLIEDWKTSRAERAGVTNPPESP
jgi:hypothetical protein